MNHTTDSSSSCFLGSSNNINGFSYGIGVSIGILLLVIAITIASYFCARKHPPTPSNTRTNNIATSFRQPPQDHPAVVVDVGLNEATILSCPKLLYSEVKVQKLDSSATCCSICLEDYKSSDMIRVLPNCGHLFHSKCIHPWLRLHSTCPLCRTSPWPTPFSTPLAEVVPLASRRDS